MSDPFVAEIRMLGCNFAPTGWAQCNGQLIPISQNTALFSLLGTFYGGDGKHTFGLPDLQGATPVHQGQSTTGTQYSVGQQGGSPFVTLLESEMPAHSHSFSQGSATVDNLNPVGLSVGRGNNVYSTSLPAEPLSMAPQALPPAGGSVPHNNMQPYLTLNFCIALQGIFPQRN